MFLPPVEKFWDLFLFISIYQQNQHRTANSALILATKDTSQTRSNTQWSQILILTAKLLYMFIFCPIFITSSIFSVYESDALVCILCELKKQSNERIDQKFITVCHWTSGSGSALCDGTDNESSMMFYFGINRGRILIVKMEMITVLLLPLQWLK